VPVKGNEPPRYPPQAAERALQGVVLVVAHLDRGGAVVRVEVVRSSGYAILDREALRAVGDWRFRPALKNGVAVASRIEVPIRFRIS
jgi:protein TonB